MTSLPRLLDLVLLASINKRRDKGRTYFTGVMRSVILVRTCTGWTRYAGIGQVLQQRAATCGFYRGLLFYQSCVLCIRATAREKKFREIRRPQLNNAGSCVQAYSNPRELLAAGPPVGHRVPAPCRTGITLGSIRKTPARSLRFGSQLPTRPTPRNDATRLKSPHAGLHRARQRDATKPDEAKPSKHPTKVARGSEA